jgi:zinc transport system permease protein
VVAALVFGVHVAFRKEIAFVAFDGEMAQTLGLRAGVWNMLLYLSFGVVSSVATRAIGALPVFAFMVIPASAALLLTNRLWSTFVVSCLIGLGAASLGYYASFRFSLPTGAAMVCVAALSLVPGTIKLRFGRGG